MGATTYPKTGGNAVEHMFQFPRQAARMSGRDRLTDGEVPGRQTLKRTPSYEARAECCGHSTGLLAQIQRGVQVRHASVRGSAGPTTSNRKRLFWALPAPAYSVQRTTSNLVAPTLPSPNGSGGFSPEYIRPKLLFGNGAIGDLLNAYSVLKRDSLSALPLANSHWANTYRSRHRRL